MAQDNTNPKSGIGTPQSPGRREWLLRMGETAVLLGFSGAVSDAMLDTPTAVASAPADATLPPGLYEPSNDHLSHALSSEARFLPAPEGSETDYLRPPTGLFRPQFVSQEEFKTARRIVELIIGEPAAPSGTVGQSADPALGSAARSDRSGDAGAVDEVAEWIDLRLSNATAVREAAQRLAPDHRALAVAYYGPGRVAEKETADPPKTCRDGLRWVEGESQRLHQKPFLLLEESLQLRLLEAISDGRPDRSEKNAGTRFFQWLKGETIRGYYTSQAGLKELDYKGNAFYAEPPGCEGHDHST